MNGYTYYNDNNHFCCEVLRKNITLGHLPEGYVDERDIREVHATDFMEHTHVHLFAGIGAFSYAFNQAHVPSTIRLLTIGFPCKNISNAGDKTGLAGHQSGLCPESARLLRELLDCGIRPQYIIVENVERLLQRGMSRVLGDLAACGYNAEWQVLPAAAFGADHIRERVLLIAYPMCEGLEGQRLSSFLTIRLSPPFRKTGLSPSDTVRERARISDYMDRIESLGNTIDTRVAEYIGRCIVAREMDSVA